MSVRAGDTITTSEIQDKFSRENFLRIKNYLTQNTNLVGFRHLEITLTSATMGKEAFFPHGLGYVPKDVLVTSTRGPALIQFNYDKFDKTNISFTPIVGDPPSQASPIIIRLYVGTHSGGNQ